MDPETRDCNDQEVGDDCEVLDGVNLMRGSCALVEESVSQEVCQKFLMFALLRRLLWADRWRFSFDRASCIAPCHNSSHSRELSMGVLPVLQSSESSLEPRRPLCVPMNSRPLDASCQDAAVRGLEIGIMLCLQPDPTSVISS